MTEPLVNILLLKISSFYFHNGSLFLPLRLSAAEPDSCLSDVVVGVGPVTLSRRLMHMNVKTHTQEKESFN